VEELPADVVGVLVTAVEACGAAIITTGAVWAIARFVWVGLTQRTTASFVPVRLTLGRFLALAARPVAGRRPAAAGRRPGLARDRDRGRGRDRAPAAADRDRDRAGARSWSAGGTGTGGSARDVVTALGGRSRALLRPAWRR